MDLKNIKNWQIATVALVPIPLAAVYFALSGNKLIDTHLDYLFFVGVLVTAFLCFDKTRKFGEILSIGTGTTLIVFGVMGITGWIFGFLTNYLRPEYLRVGTTGWIFGASQLISGLLFLTAGTHNSKPLGFASKILITGLLAQIGFNEYWIATQTSGDIAYAAGWTMLFELGYLAITIVLILFLHFDKTRKIGVALSILLGIIGIGIGGVGNSILSVFALGLITAGLFEVYLLFFKQKTNKVQ